MTVLGGLEYSSSQEVTEIVVLTGAGGAGDVSSTPVPVWARQVTIQFLEGSEVEAAGDAFSITATLTKGVYTSPAFIPYSGTIAVTAGDMDDDYIRTFDSPVSNVSITIATAILIDTATATFAVTFTG